MIIELKAKLLTEEGRPKKLLIPPSTTKVCPVSLPTSYDLTVNCGPYIVLSLAMKSLFLIRVGPWEPGYYFEPLIYNGGWENQWIEHEEHIVNIC